MRIDMRRLSAIVLTLALVATLVPLAGPAVAVGTFDDDDGNVHEANIEKIAALGITKGCNPPANNLYCPDDYVTRQQMASFLVRAFDLPPAPAGQFTDIAGSVHEADINALAASGITKGCNPPANTQYCPTDQVTRGQMAAFMARGLDLANITDNFFTDDNGNIFEGQINAIARIGITKGCNPPDNTEYCPDNPVRRDEMASFLARVADILTTGTTVTTTPAPTTTTPGATTTTTLPLPPGKDYDQFVSTSSDRSSPVVLNGATVSGNIYVFAGPDAEFSQADFFVDDPAMTGPPAQVEFFSLYDLAGTNPNLSARPFDTFTLKNGSHTVTVRLALTGGGTDVVTSTFTVNNPASVWVSAQNVSFNLPPNGSSGSAKTVQVDSNTQAAINWTASDNQPWLTFVNSTGTGGQNVSFNASAAGLTPGVRTAIVTVTAPGYQTRTFTVTMNVLAVGPCPSPNGTDVRVTTPYSLGFTSAVAGSVAGANGNGTGFTCVQATSMGQGYLASNLLLDTAGGTLSINTTAGLAVDNLDTQDNALGVGFQATGAVTVLTTTILNPAWEGNGGFEQAGLWVGVSEDNYVKGVVVDTPQGNRILLQLETAGSAAPAVQTAPIATAPGSVTLRLTMNDASNNVALEYSLDGGEFASVGFVTASDFIINGTDPDGTGGPTSAGVTMGGIFASHRTGAAKTYTFGDFSLSN